MPSEHILESDGMIRINKKHCTLRELLWAGLLRPADVSALVKLTTVRNPFDSLVSLYVKKRYKYQTLLEDANAWVHRVAGYVADMQYCREHTFEEWIFVNYNKGPLSRIYWLKRRSFSEKYTAGVDYVMRYEYLQEDFNKALSLAGIHRPLSIPTVNVTSERRESYREYYTPRARHIVERVFASELRKYGYAF